MDGAELRFTRWKAAGGASASALKERPGECGVYVLEFANGAEYVGKSVNFSTRFASHRRRWQDIINVRFAPVRAEELDAAERSVIQTQVDAGIRLRNLTLPSRPLGTSPLDLVIDREVQTEWLEPTSSDEANTVQEERFLQARVRANSRDRHNRLRARPAYPEVLTSVATYIAEVIPFPDLTEGRLWTLTAMPSTNRSGSNRRLATLSIHTVEVLFLGEATDAHGQWQPYTQMNTAVMHPVPADLGHVVELSDHYRSAGQVHSFSLEGHDVVRDLLSVAEVRQAARELAIGQLRKGRGAFSRHHNEAFADDVFALVEEHLRPRPVG